MAQSLSDVPKMKGAVVAENWPPTTPEGWGGVIAGVATVFLTVRKGLQKIGMLEPPVDVEKVATAVARAVMAEKDIADREHRDAIVTALGKVDASIHSVNSATAQNIRAALELYGKDVAQIRTAQERVERQIDSLSDNIAELRVEVASR